MNIKYLRNIISFVLLLACLYACERDDICPPNTPTTPRVVIEFFDFEDFQENKEVPQLSYIAEGSQDTIAFSGDVDSITLPLNTNVNTTKFKLIRNTGDDVFENTDEIEFVYQVDDVYVNRSCGFKAIYSNLSATRIPDTPITENWIRSISVEQLDVENEQVTHVFIFH